MSIRREQDKDQGSGCGLGLALAAAVIGVGVGGALYYFLHKGPEQESTSSRWQREQPFRERSWSQEQCSICFDVMLKNQELMNLPCTHYFHAACIKPWLEQQRTCPICRKAA